MSQDLRDTLGGGCRAERNALTRALRLTLGVLLLVLAAGCAGSTEAPESAARPETGADHEQAISLYDLELAMTDQNGRDLTIADLRGRPLVVAMVYTSCKSVCPRITADMKAVERTLTPHQRQSTDFVLFSLDPGRDSPEAMRAFTRDHGLDQSRWRMFATDEEGVFDLAAALGVKHRRMEDDEIAHSAMIFVVDRNGVVRHAQVGLGEDPVPLMEALRDAGA